MLLGALLQGSGTFFFRYRNAVFPLYLIVLFAAFPPNLPGAGDRLGHWLNGLGLVLAAGGQALRAAVIGFAYIKRGGLNKQVYASSLVTEGIFGICRNPLYVGNLMTLGGLLMVHGNPWVMAFGTAFFLYAYASIVAAEEAYLHGRFGSEYAAYCRAVNRWRPDFGRLVQATAGMRFNWRRVVIKDYGTFCSWTAGAVLLLAYRAVYAEGVPRAAPVLTACVAALVLLGLTAAAVRFAKKSGRLTEHSA